MDRLRNAVGLGRRDSSSNGDEMLSPLTLDSHLLDGGYEPDSPGAAEAAPGHGWDSADAQSRSANEASYRAYAAQVRNNDVFMENQRQEEEQIYNEIRARRLREEENHKVAQRIRKQFATRSYCVLIDVGVPDKVHGGMFLKVVVPGAGEELVQVPPGLAPGDSFVYMSPHLENMASAGATPEQVWRVVIPDGVSEGQQFDAQLPTGERVRVTAPEGARAGDTVVLPLFNQDARPAQLTEEELSEREAFLAALPEDIRREFELEHGGYPLPGPGSQAHTAAEESPGAGVNDQRRQGWVDMAEVTIPQGVTEGDTFPVRLVNGRNLSVAVPPGFQPGDVLGVPISESEEETLGAPSQDTQGSEQGIAINLDAREREEFLAALPADVRDEILAAERSQLDTQPNQGRSGNGAHDGHGLDVAANATVPDLLSGEFSAGEEDVLGMNSRPSQENLLDFGTGATTSSGSSQGTSAQALATHASDDTINLMDDYAQRSTSAHPSATGGQQPPAAPSGFDFLASHSQTPPHAAPTDSHAPDLATQAQTAQAPLPSPSSQPSTKPPLERLKEAKAQLERGEISQHEFSRIKKEVIDAI